MDEQGEGCASVLLRGSEVLGWWRSLERKGSPRSPCSQKAQRTDTQRAFLTWLSEEECESV